MFLQQKQKSNLSIYIHYIYIFMCSTSMNSTSITEVGVLQGNATGFNQIRGYYSVKQIVFCLPIGSEQCLLHI